MVQLKAKRVGSLKKLKAATKRQGGGDIKNVPKDDTLTVRFLEDSAEWIEYYEYYSETTEPRFFPDIEGMDPDFVQDLRKPSKRFLANVVDRQDNQVVALKIPTSLASKLARCEEKFGTLMDRDYELSKEGDGLQTEYDALPEVASKFNPTRFKPLDLMKVLISQLPEEIAGSVSSDDDDDDDDDDEPIRSRRSTSSGVKRKPIGRTRTEDKVNSGIKKRPTGGIKKRPR